MLTSAGKGRQQQDEDEQEMKETIDRARGGFASRDAARKPDGAHRGTPSSASHVRHPNPWSKHLPQPAGAEASVPGHLSEMQSRSTAQVWISEAFPSPCLDTEEMNWVWGSMAFLVKQNRQRLIPSPLRGKP